jgi:hypothetical protein
LDEATKETPHPELAVLQFEETENTRYALESFQGEPVHMEELRQQVISDLEDVQTAQSFFDNLVQSVDALLSDKIAGFVEGVQVSQKIAKNVWAEGSINRSTWHSSESEH